MKIVRLADLHGAEKYGSCNECGKDSDSAELYRIITECQAGERTYHSSICLCKGCLAVMLATIQAELKVKMCELADTDVVRIVTDIFHPKKITRIKRHKREDYISCNIYTEWSSKDENGKEDTVICCDELIIRNPFDYGMNALKCDGMPLNANDYRKFKQFCSTHLVTPDWMKDNPYIEEKNNVLAP